MTDLPEPLTPTDCDLRGMEWMPLHGHKLYGSDFDAIASDAEYRAAQRLWWSAWQQQVPAASLPDDDRVLAHAAGYGRDPKGWAKIREVALHAFVKCSDGRLYHRFLAPEAIVAWERRVKERDRKAAYRAKRDGNSGGQDGAVPNPVPRDNAPDSSGTECARDEDVTMPSHVDRTTQDRTGPLSKEERTPSLREAPQKRKCRLPADWAPSEAGLRFAADHGADAQREFPKFRDHHTAKGSVMVDWDAAWRTWCQNARRFGGGKTEPQEGAFSRMVREERSAGAFVQPDFDEGMLLQ